MLHHTPRVRMIGCDPGSGILEAADFTDSYPLELDVSVVHPIAMWLVVVAEVADCVHLRTPSVVLQRGGITRALSSLQLNWLKQAACGQ